MLHGSGHNPGNRHLRAWLSCRIKCLAVASFMKSLKATPKSWQIVTNNVIADDKKRDMVFRHVPSWLIPSPRYLPKTNTLVLQHRAGARSREGYRRNAWWG